MRFFVLVTCCCYIYVQEMTTTNTPLAGCTSHKVSARALHQRALAAEHLQGSAAIVNARGAQLELEEALYKGWVQPQPTTFR